MTSLRDAQRSSPLHLVLIHVTPLCSEEVTTELTHFSLDSRDGRKSPGYTSKVRVRDRYNIVGFISSGTYGRVYKATGKNGKNGEFAIKKSVTKTHSSYDGIM